jgi:hypothetical protein
VREYARQKQLLENLNRESQPEREKLSRLTSDRIEGAKRILESVFESAVPELRASEMSDLVEPFYEAWTDAFAEVLSDKAVISIDGSINELSTILREKLPQIRDIETDIANPEFNSKNVKEIVIRFKERSGYRRPGVFDMELGGSDVELPSSKPKIRSQGF